MPEQEQHVIEVFKFTSCENWDTDACPHRDNAYMQLYIINRSILFLLNDLATEELWNLCSGCTEFRQKDLQHMRKPNMTERRTWIACRHIMDGSATTAILAVNGLCACNNCTENVNLMETDQVHIIEEDRLLGILKDLKTVHGIENVKKRK